MKLPEFDWKEAEWDSYREFHILHGYGGQYRAFVQFANSSLILTASKFDNDKRGKIDEKFDVGVYFTTDAKCPSFYLPDSDKPVPSAWLCRQGGQNIVVDREHMMGTGLCHSFKSHPAIPVGLLQRARVYWARPGAKPIGGRINVGSPYPWTPEERDQVNGLLAATRVWVRLTDDPKQLVLDPLRDRWAERERRQRMNKPVPAREMLGVTFGELGKEFRIRLIANGIDWGYDKERQVNSLIVKSL